MINIHRINTGNIGDVVSSPCLYFPIQASKVDIYSKDINFKEDILLGGGGLFCFGDELKNIFINKKCKLIGWGIGLNSKKKEVIFPDFSYFDLLGIRDDIGLKWVPCASCMSSLFDNKYEIKNEIVIYEHRNNKIDLDFPKMSNWALF